MVSFAESALSLCHSLSPHNTHTHAHTQSGIFEQSNRDTLGQVKANCARPALLLLSPSPSLSTCCCNQIKLITKQQQRQYRRVRESVNCRRLSHERNTKAKARSQSIAAGRVVQKDNGTVRGGVASALVVRGQLE